MKPLLCGIAGLILLVPGNSQAQDRPEPPQKPACSARAKDGAKEMRALLEVCDEEFRKSLVAILEAKSTKVEDLVDAFRWKGKSVLGYAASNKSDVPVHGMAVELVKRLNIPVKDLDYLSTHDAMHHMLKWMLQEMWNKMTEDQRREWIKSLDLPEEKARRLIKIVSGSGAAAVAVLAGADAIMGFGLYIWLSTAIKATGAALGLGTLPWWIYQANSTIVGFLASPAGIIACAALIGVTAAVLLDKPDYQACLKALVLMHSKKDQLLVQYRKEVDVYNAKHKTRIDPNED